MSDTGMTPWGMGYEVHGDQVIDASGEAWTIVGPVADETFFDKHPHEPYTIYSTRGAYRVSRKLNAGERAKSDREARGYAAFMDAAEAEWSSLISAITALLPGDRAAYLDQTGGMCLAISWPLNDDAYPYAIVTTEGPISPKRENEKGYSYFLGLHDEDGAREDVWAEYPESDAGDPTQDAKWARILVDGAVELLNKNEVPA